MFQLKVMCSSAIIAAVFFESIGGRSLQTPTNEATTGHSADCLDAVGLPAKEGYSVSKKYPCQLETCTNGSWVIERCIEDVDPKCKGHYGTQGPGSYPECCAYAVACSKM
ncbi:uncharacterized protein LOC144180469 [Haemaphysalis longicornis]